MSNLGWRKQICKNGHDTFITGRYKNGKCKMCEKEKYERTKVKVFPLQFCKRGHEIAVVGRDKWGKCIQCGIDYRKERYVPHPHQPKQFCIHGHDTLVCGRDKKRMCLECKRIYNVQYIKENPEIRLRAGKKNYWKHREERLAYHRVWDKEHRKELTDANVEYTKRRKQEDPVFKLTLNLRSRLLAAIKNKQKVGSAVRDLGCTVEFLKDYIEAKFYGAMTWENHGTYWELDHIKALVEYNLEDLSQFKQAVHYTNLQPLTKPDHRKKTAKELRHRRKIIKIKKEQ